MNVNDIFQTMTTKPQNLLPEVIREVEVRSRFSPPMIFKVADLIKPAPGGSSSGGAPPTSGGVPTTTDGKPLDGTTLIKPTVILRGGALSKPIVYAPGGVAGPNDWKVLLAIGGVLAMALFGGGVLLGKRLERRKS